MNDRDKDVGAAMYLECVGSVFSGSMVFPLRSGVSAYTCETTRGLLTILKFCIRHIRCLYNVMHD